jgi:hypothetical protein
MSATDQLDEEFNPATEEGTPDLALLAKGNYVARITDAVIKPYKSGKGQGVFLTWELVDDAYAGRKVWSNCTLVHESEKATKFGRQQFKDICDACGVTESFRDLTLLYDKPCSIWIGVEESDDYPPKNAVGKVRSIQAKKAKSQPVNGAADKPFNDEVPY